MEWITPNWPAACNVHALTTLRHGGYSQGSYESLNLAAHVGDSPEAVTANRRLLESEAMLPSEPFWLTQVHGTTVLDIPSKIPQTAPTADASVCFIPGKVCAVLTADCLPVLICDVKGTSVSAIHAGWRGLAAGVIEAAVQKLNCPPDTLMAWLGPAIGPDSFEVGEDVCQAFQGYEKAFKSTQKTKWKADIYELARLRLLSLGITQIFGGGLCTYSDEDRFYSFRRSSETGRMATLIWLS